MAVLFESLDVLGVVLGLVVAESDLVVGVTPLLHDFGPSPGQTQHGHLDLVVLQLLDYLGELGASLFPVL